MLLGRPLKTFAVCLVTVLVVGFALQAPAWARQSLKTVELDELTEAQVNQLLRMDLDIGASAWKASPRRRTAPR